MLSVLLVRRSMGLARALEEEGHDVRPRLECLLQDLQPAVPQGLASLGTAKDCNKWEQKVCA